MSWSSQCNGLTKARVQCRRSAPGGYCWQHTDQQRTNYSITYTTSKIDTHDILSGRKCRGKTVQGSKCKTVLVHQTGEYCWQHTYQAENYDSDSSDSGTRRCRGQTLKHARCKRMLVHYPGHYCWQHTEQAPLPSKVKKEKEKLSSQIVLAKAPKAVVPPHVIYYDEVYISPNPSGPILVMPPPRILAIAESADSDSSGTGSSSGNGDFAEDSGFFEMAPVELLNDSLTIEEGADASFANVMPYTTVTTLRSSDGAGEPEEKEREEEKEEEKEEAEVVSTNTGTHTDVSPVEDGEKTTVDNTSTTNYLPPPPESLESGIVSLLLLDAPRVPTEVPSEPKSKATLGVTTWTVLDLPGEQKQLHTEKSQKPRASRSCGFNWLSTALMYPFRHLNQNKPTAIVPSASPETSVSTEKIAAVKQENIGEYTFARSLLLTVAHPLHRMYHRKHWLLYSHSNTPRLPPPRRPRRDSPAHLPPQPIRPNSDEAWARPRPDPRCQRISLL